jgi:hypothetical protein
VASDVDHSGLVHGADFAAQGRQALDGVGSGVEGGAAAVDLAALVEQPSDELVIIGYVLIRRLPGRGGRVTCTVLPVTALGLSEAWYVVCEGCIEVAEMLGDGAEGEQAAARPGQLRRCRGELIAGVFHRLGVADGDGGPRGEAP